MTSRRQFIAGTVAATCFAGITDCPAISADSSRRARRVNRCSIPRIESVTRIEETVKRFSGHGDNWHMSWADNDRQYVSLCDGFGFSGQSKYLYNASMLALQGAPENATFHQLAGYPQLAYYPSQKLGDPRYYPFGTLALDGRLYQFMSTFNRGLIPQDIGTTDATNAEIAAPFRFNGVKAIYSADNGRTWRNQDGSTPVVWDSWSSRSRDTLLFFEEDQDAFSLLSVLQMGRGYKQNIDGYVYIYSPNGNTDGTMNQLVMLRVRRDALLNREAYEFYAGRHANGNAKWTPDMGDRQVVHTFPRGWVNTSPHPFAWQPSIVYNAPLSIYMMVNWGMGATPDGLWFGKPSYLGMWVARNPWGPWTQVYEESTWKPAGESSARAYQPQISPKWLAEDGKSFFLVWTDLQTKGDPAEYRRLREPLGRKSFDDYTLADWSLHYELFRRFKPYYSFNTQRVDLTVAR